MSNNKPKSTGAVVLSYDDFPDENDQEHIALFLTKLRHQGTVEEGTASDDPSKVVLATYILTIADLEASDDPSARLILNTARSKAIVSGMPPTADRAPTEKPPLDADEEIYAVAVRASGARGPDEMVERFGQVNRDPPPPRRRGSPLPTADPPAPPHRDNPTLSPPSERQAPDRALEPASPLAGQPPVTRTTSNGAVDMMEFGLRSGNTPAPAQPRKDDSTQSPGPTPFTVEPSARKAGNRSWQVQPGDPEPPDHEANTPTARGKLGADTPPMETAPTAATAAEPVPEQKSGNGRAPVAARGSKSTLPIIMVGVVVLILAFVVVGVLLSMVEQRPPSAGVVPATTVPETPVNPPVTPPPPVDKVPEKPPEIHPPKVDLTPPVTPPPAFTVSSSYEAGGQQTCVVGTLTGAAFTRIGAEKLVLCGKGVLVKGNIITVQGTELTPQDLNESMKGQATMADKEYEVKGVTVYCQTDGGAVNNQPPCTLK